jgi:hypothetical protein
MPVEGDGLFAHGYLYFAGDACGAVHCVRRGDDGCCAAGLDSIGGACVGLINHVYGYALRLFLDAWGGA